MLYSPLPFNIPLSCTLLILVLCYRQDNLAEAVQGCSVFFQPDFKWKKAICDSETSRLDRIPLDLPTNLVELHVTHQFISVLGAEGLRSLIHLQTLAIESSGLRRIMLDALHTLTNLTQLNLRNNSLQLGYNGLPAEVIRSLPRLKMLNLAENPVDIVPDWFFTLPGSGTPSPLHRLWLGSTKSAAMLVERQAFAGLGQLRLLDLSFAKLTTLPVSLASQLDSMIQLKELYLGGNLWHCDCQLRWLRRWFVKRQVHRDLIYVQQHVNRYGRQVTSEPICFSPEPLRDRKLFGMDPMGTIDFSEFNCAPKLLTDHQNVTLMAGKVNKLVCEFYADPKASVSWFKDGVPIKNDSHFSVTNQFIEETLVSYLRVQFTRVGETSSVTCALDGYHGEISATYHVTVIPYDASLDEDQDGLTGGLEFAGLSVTHQSWIYAGVGAGILFILLTSIGVVIFYCCDPRSHADQTFQRIVGKDQVNRLRSCYGCQKLPGSAVKQNGEDSREKSTDASGVRTNDTRSQEDEAEAIELCSRSNSPLDQALSKPVFVAPVKSDLVTSPVTALSTTRANLTPLGGSLIQETVSTGENRLLVSCDGPEPTVLLATRLSAYNDLSSPSSVYGMFDATKLSPSIKVSLPGSISSYICSPSFSGQAPTGIVDKTHIYASLSPVTNLQGLNKTPQLISLPKSRYTTPCPVHGSIQLDRVGLSQTQSSTGPESVPSSTNIDQTSGTAGSIRTGTIGSGSALTSSAPGTTLSATTAAGLVQKSVPVASNPGSQKSSVLKLDSLPEQWYRPVVNRSKFGTPDEEAEEEDNQDEEEDDDVEDDEEEEEDEDEDDDDSGLLPHSTTLYPSTKSDIPFRGAAQFIDPRRFKSRGGTTLHRPKSFTVLNSRMIGGKSRLIMPQSGSVHTMHPDPHRTGRGYLYPVGDKGFSSGGVDSSPTCRRFGTHHRPVIRISPRRPPTVRPIPLNTGVSYKPCIRPSFSGELDSVPDPSTVHGPTGSNPETSDEAWNSNSNSDSDTETPTEETSSLTQAVEVMSNTERATYDDHEFAHLSRRSAVRRRGSSSTLHFPTTGWSNYPPTGGPVYPPSVASAAAASAAGMRSAGGGIYRVATLPSRFRKSHSPGTGSTGVIFPGHVMRTTVPGGSYRDFSTLQRRASTQRSQTLVRPGSKHKLDTDSGTDNND